MADGDDDGGFKHRTSYEPHHIVRQTQKMANDLERIQI